MSQYKTYPTYKDSGVEWIGQVPKHWDVVQSRRLFSERKERAYEDDKQYTSSQKYGVILQTEFMEKEGRRIVLVEKGQEILKHIETGDFLISMRSFQGGLEECTSSGCVSSAYVPLVPIKWVWNPFFKYLFKSNAYIQALQGTSDLIRDGQALRFENFSKVSLLRIPVHEQKEIASFLDRETARIDILIEKKTRFIELLKEKIVAIAMTEQMYGDTELIRLRHLVQTISRPVKIIDGDEYVALGLYNRGRGLFHKPPTLGKDIGDSDFFYVEEGDLILSGQFAWEGAVTIASSKEIGCIVSHRYPVLRGVTITTEYLLALLMTNFGDFLLNESSRGSAGRNRPLNINLLLNEKVRVPSAKAQKKISRLIKLKAILEEKVEKSITFLKERRAAFITAAVTGQIDLRGK